MSQVCVCTSKPDGFNSNLKVVGIFLVCNGKHLLLENSARKNIPFKFGITGGKVHPAETALQAIIRESYEEVGLSLSSNKIKFVCDSYITTPGWQYKYSMFYYEFNVEPNITLSDEHNSYKWIKPEKISTLDLLPATHETFMLYQEKMNHN